MSFFCYSELFYCKRKNITACKRMLFKDLPSLRKPSVPETGPGAMALTRTPLGPHSTARCLVIASADTQAGKGLESARGQKDQRKNQRKAFTICSLGRSGVHLEALSSVPKCCRDVDYVSTVILFKELLKINHFCSFIPDE